MADSVIAVPIGKGIDRGTDEFLVGPPAVHNAENVRLSSRGAYEKRPGASLLVSNIGSATETTVTSVRDGRTNDELVVYGNRSMAVYSPNGTTKTIDYGGLVPSEVHTHPAWFPAGTILAVNLAHGSGYTAVCATVASEPQRIEKTNTEAVIGQIAIYDSDWKLVWGPHKVPELAWLPRVEAVTRSDGTQGFVFFGIFDHEPSETAPGLHAALLSLYASLVWVDDLDAPSPYLISDEILGTDEIWSTDTPNLQHVWYDTYSVNGDSVYLGHWVDKVTKDGKATLCLVKVDTEPTLFTTTYEVAHETVDTIKSLGVYYHPESDTCALYTDGNKTYYCTDGAFSVTPVATAGPTLNDIPVWYRSGNGDTYLTNHRILFVGSSPGTPSLGTPHNYRPPYHRRPLPNDTYDWVFTRLKTTERAAMELIYPGEPSPILALLGNAPDSVTGGQELEVLDADSSGNRRLHTLVPLNYTRQPWRVRDNWHGLWAEPGTDLNPIYPRKSHVAGTVGQSAMTADGHYLIPQIISTPVYLADDRVVFPEPLPEPGPADAARGVVDRETLSRPMAGTTSYWGDQTRIVIQEVILRHVDSSSIGLNGSVLTTAGNLHVFDGQCSFEPCPEPAAIYAPFSELIPAPGDSNQEVAKPGWDYSVINDGQGVEWKCILVYTDSNGVKYRSGDVNTFWEPISAIDIIAPKFVIELLPSHLPPMVNGNGWQLEVYRSDVYTKPAEPSNHKWVGTLPITWDVANERWIADGSNLLSEGPLPVSYITTPVPPYTDSELPNHRPPALTALTRAGRYIFAVAQENPYEIWHTKPLTDFIGPEFNPNLMLYAPAESGGVVSLAAAGDRLLVLCRNGIWELFVANGPDAAGQGAFPEFRKIWSGDGCVTHKWTVSDTPFGAMFCSHSGPKLVRLDGSIVDVGERVRGLYDSSQAQCSVYDPVHKEIWLFHRRESDLNTLVYDCVLDEWTTSTFEADSAFFFEDTLCRLVGRALVAHDENTTYDNGVSFSGKITSPWLTLTSTQGYFRVKRIAALLRHIAGTVGTIKISVEYNYNTGVVDTFTWDASDVLALDNMMQLRFKPGTQKVDAIRITIEDEPGQKDQETVRWSLAGLTIKTQQKHGVVKLEEGASQ